MRKRGFSSLAFALQIKQVESHCLFVKTYFSTVFYFCKLWVTLETILLLSVVIGNIPLLGLRCRVVFWGDAAIYFWWLPRLLFSFDSRIWQVDQKSWRKAVLLGWKSLRCQPQGRVENRINKGGRLIASVVSLVNPLVLIVVLKSISFFPVKAELFVVLNANNRFILTKRISIKIDGSVLFMQKHNIFLYILFTAFLNFPSCLNVLFCKFNEIMNTAAVQAI